MTTTANLTSSANKALAKSSLAGAEFVSYRHFEHGTQFTLQLVPGQHTLGNVQQMMPRISSALQWPMEKLIVERHPDFIGDDDEDPTILQFTIIRTSPIKDTVWFDQPRFVDGFIQMGPYADGIGEAFLQLYSKNSMHHSFLLGGSGIGKSRCIECAVISALAMGNTIIFYMDGQNGASSPTLFEKADWAVGVEDAPTMMSALESAAKWRQAENVANKWPGFTPSLARPGIWVIIDEQHRIAPLFGERLAFAVSEYRKVGIAFFGADQDSSLKATFANQDRMRAGMLGGNGFVMNVQSRIAGNLIPGCDTHPADLPRIPGYAMRVAAADCIDPDGQPGRTAPFRNRYSPNREEKADLEAAGVYVPVPAIEDWFELFSNPEMDRGTARAMGDDYRYRHEIRQASLEQVQALVNATDEEYARLAHTLWVPAQRGDRQQTVGGSMAITSTTTTSTTTTTRVELTAESRSFAEAIRALNWDGGLDLGTLMSQFPQVRLGVAKPAIESLVIDGELVKDQVPVDGGRTQDVYRKALPAGQAKKASAREAILSLPWKQHPEMDRGDIITALRTAGHQHSEASIDQALRALCTANPAVLVKEPGRGTPYRLA